MNKNILLILLLLITSLTFSNAEKENFEDKIVKTNNELEILRHKLDVKFQEANFLYENQADEAEYIKLLNEINELKLEIKNLQEKYRESCVEGSIKSEGSYAFWDQGETTLSQLLLEYGSTDYLYVIPYELGSLKLNVYSSIPLPHESWNDMIELILSHNGIGIKQLNPYLRQLYIFKHDPTNVSGIVHSLKDLKILPDSAWVFYVFSPMPEQIKSVQSFFDRFSDPKKTTIQIVGSKIVIVSYKENVEKLIKLYEAVWGKDQGKVVHVFHLNKIPANEAEKVLKTYFQEPATKNRPSFFHSGADELLVMSLASNSSLVVMGNIQLVERAKQMINDLENQLEDPSEMTVFWYTCKHSDPQDLANILEQVYSSLSSAKIETKQVSQAKSSKPLNQKSSSKTNNTYHPSMPISPSMVMPGSINRNEEHKSMQNFIVDPKSGSILIVVKRYELEKIKHLLKKLDVPKKMVQIEVLLVEKRMQDNKQTGINLLKIGSSSNRETSLQFDTNENAPNKGILDFIVSKARSRSFPAFDFTASFLMAQEDIKISAAPSILAINQTPATISIVEERSINNGAVKVVDNDSTAIDKSYSRAQFGITIVMTPTIHLPDASDANSKGFVTLQTNITFDTNKSKANEDKPLIARRHIENEIRIADGETIILGGLRKQSEEDKREKIPFLGDLPGIGKLFGTTKMSDDSSEMFMFITPHIIKDPIEDLKELRTDVLMKRPGDIPEFMTKLEEAKKQEKIKLFEKSIQMVLDRF